MPTHYTPTPTTYLLTYLSAAVSPPHTRLPPHRAAMNALSIALHI